MNRKTISSFMTPSKVDLSNFNADLESQQVRVDSEILHPISNVNTGTNDYLKFVITQKGILSPKSRIQFCGTTSSAYGDDTAFYPALTGGLSMVKSARLMIGNRTIATSQSFNQFIANQRGLVRPCKRMGVDAVLKLTNDNYKVVNDATNAINDGVGVFPGETDYEEPQDEAVFNTFSKVGSTATGSPTFSIALDELFPFLAENLDLPLFVLKPNEQVILHLDLQNDGAIGDRTVRDAGNTNWAQTLLHIPDVKMICDYVYFNQDRMDEIMNSFRVRGDLTEYVDLQLVEQTLTNLAADTANTQKVILTGTNRVCRGIFMNYQNDYTEVTSVAVKSVFGHYFSENCDKGRGFNLTINNQQLLVTTPSDMRSAENYYYYSTFNGNNPAYIPYHLYNAGVGAMTDNQVNQINQTNLTGKNSPIGISFGNDGFAINSVPLQMTFYRKQLAEKTACKMWCWCLIRRVFSINNNGSVSVSF